MENNIQLTLKMIRKDRVDSQLSIKQRFPFNIDCAIDTIDLAKAVGVSTCKSGHIALHKCFKFLHLRRNTKDNITVVHRTER